MKKQYSIIVILVIIAIVGIGFVVTSNDATTPTETEQTKNASGESAVEEPPIEEQNPSKNTGTYVELTENAIAEAKGDVYLFFHAPWCPQCRSIESGIKTDGVPADTTVIKVDYDSNQALRQKYGVTLQTTFVKINNSGDFISKFVAYQDPTFSSVVRDYFKK